MRVYDCLSCLFLICILCSLSRVASQPKASEPKIVRCTASSVRDDNVSPIHLSFDITSEASTGLFSVRTSSEHGWNSQVTLRLLELRQHASENSLSKSSTLVARLCSNMNGKESKTKCITPQTTDRVEEYFGRFEQFDLLAKNANRLFIHAQVGNSGLTLGQLAIPVFLATNEFNCDFNLPDAGHFLPQEQKNPCAHKLCHSRQVCSSRGFCFCKPGYFGENCKRI
eukprot:Nk52_evm2s371 gene=Nk52_evmTU2s371